MAYLIDSASVRLSIARNLFRSVVSIIAVLGIVGAANAADKKPNILVIWGDDIGTWNISHNNRGMMGYQDTEHRSRRA